MVIKLSLYVLIYSTAQSLGRVEVPRGSVVVLDSLYYHSTTIYYNIKTTKTKSQRQKMIHITVQYCDSYKSLHIIQRQIQYH